MNKEGRSKGVYCWKCTHPAPPQLLISSSRDGTLRVTDMENRLLKCVCRLHARGVVGFDYSHELGVVASFGNERKVILWVVDGASHLMSVKMPSVPTSVALTPTTNQLVTLHMDFSIRLWDLRNGNPVQVIASPCATGFRKYA